MRALVALVALATAGCAPQALVVATSHFAQVSATAEVDIAATPGIVARVCRLRAELEYLAQRVHLGDDVPSFTAFFTSTAFPLQLPGAPTITWRQQCLAYHVADEAFARAVDSIRAYTTALGGFAESRFDSSAELEAITKSAADSAALVSTSARAYQTALEGIGHPLAKIAGVAARHWQADELRALVDQTDPPLHEAIAKLDAFVGVLRGEQLRDLREALDTFRQEMKFRANVDLVSAAIVDVDMTERLANIDHQLIEVSNLLHLFATAHGELMRSWDAGDGDAAARAMAAYEHEMGAVARAYATASGGD
jgi:hypothetical protein